MLNSRSTSGIDMRMQPCDTLYPIDAGSFVPWIPTPAQPSPIQRVPSGLSGPGGMGSAPTAQGESGGVQVGSTTLEMIELSPVGVGYAGCPTATPKVTVCLPARYSVSVWLDSSITIRVVMAPTVSVPAMPSTGIERSDWKVRTA